MIGPTERDRMRKLLLVGCAALVLGGSAAVATSQTPRNETFRMLELFGDVVGIVEQAYVVPVDNKKLIEAALAGMMTALDPHSNYLAPSNYDELRERTEGQYSGVGLTITSEGGMVKVISPMDESPAAKAGVQAGDVISSIEGQNAAGLTVTQVSEKLRGGHQRPRHLPARRRRAARSRPDARDHQGPVRHRPGRGRLRLSARLDLQREHRPRTD
jgi:carboxyl-terminal processing protease